MINPNDNVLYQGFKVQYRVVGRVGDWSVVTVYGIDKRSLVLSGMRPGLSYEVIVKASSDQSEGNPSHPVIITTLESGELNSFSTLWSHGLLSSTELWSHLLLFYLSRTSQTSLGQRGKRVNSLLDQNFLRIKEFIHKTFHRVPWVTDTLFCLCHRVGNIWGVGLFRSPVIGVTASPCKEKLLTPLGPKIAKKKKAILVLFWYFLPFLLSVCANKNDLFVASYLMAMILKKELQIVKIVASLPL